MRVLPDAAEVPMAERGQVMEVHEIIELMEDGPDLVNFARRRCAEDVGRKQPMELKVKLDEGAKLPRRAYPTDAGADLFAPHDVTVPARGSAVIDTGAHVELPDGTCGLLVSKSGLNVRDSVLSTGLIDSGYTGSITVKLYNLGDKPVHLSKGSKVSQLVVLPVLCPDIVEADEIRGGPRGDAGFGSTDVDPKEAGE